MGRHPLARIHADRKALEAMGLSISDAIRLLMLRIADERRLPFEVKASRQFMRDVCRSC